MTSNLRTQ